MRTFERYVAISDSTTEGIDDPYPDGTFRGWADRLAGKLAEVNPELRYANLAIRGRLAGQIRAEQLQPAVALKPDLATVVAGLNDTLRPGFDAQRVQADLEAMYTALTDVGATVVGFTMPDPSPFSPIARKIQHRLIAFNEVTREAAERTGVLLVDLNAYPVASDPRLWSEDRLHANSEGHARIAAALAEALELPGADGAWSEPLPPLPPRGRAEAVVHEVSWAVRFLVPWAIRRLRGRSSGDGITAKRPDLAPVLDASGAPIS
jgi:lysophospholipase L1-like esterase